MVYHVELSPSPEFLGKPLFDQPKYFIMIEYCLGCGVNASKKNRRPFKGELSTCILSLWSNSISRKLDKQFLEISSILSRNNYFCQKCSNSSFQLQKLHQSLVDNVSLQFNMYQYELYHYQYQYIHMNQNHGLRHLNIEKAFKMRKMILGHQQNVSLILILVYDQTFMHVM